MSEGETRWWWVRHAPVVGHDGRIYGQSDMPCDCSDADAMKALAGVLPTEAVWITSHLKRTVETAAGMLNSTVPGASSKRSTGSTLALRGPATSEKSIS